MARIYKSEEERAKAYIWGCIECKLDKELANDLTDEVYTDVMETADPDNWNWPDVDIALNRVLKKRLGFEDYV